MYFIHYIQTYASVNRKGSELQEYVLQLKDSLIKNREVLDDLKEELHCRIVELDAKYPRTQPLHMYYFDYESQKPAGRRNRFLSRGKDRR